MVAAGTPSVPDVPGRGSNRTVWVVSAAVLGGLVLIGILAAVFIPVFLDQRDKAADASANADAGISANADAGISANADVSAQSDVATLGKEIATWYVDNDGPPPAVEASGGQYLVDGYTVGDVSPGVVLGGVTGTGMRDWCVWVTNPEGDLKNFEYSAERGLQAGTC
jgi:type II secretory pathway pseudopilin PulG